jgi:hypothetical protein
MDSQTSPIETNAPQLPGYKEIMREIMKQLNNRKGTLSLRVLLVLAPVLLGIGVMLVLGQMDDVLGNSFTESAFFWVPEIIAILSLLISPWWMLIVGHIFKVERIIWIDAFFDKVTVTGSQSWKMARKLFWPSVGLDLILFIRYYLLIYLAVLGSITGYIALSVNHTIKFQPLVFIIGLIIIGVVLWLYGTYIRVKLRYVWFLFIDFHGTEQFSYKFLFSELKKLNSVYSSEAFKKLMVTSFGTDAAGEAVNIAVGAGTRGLAALGDAGKAADFFINTIAGESVEIAKDYAKTTAFYMYYRIARTVLYGQAQIVNGSLYSNNSPSTSSKN